MANFTRLRPRIHRALSLYPNFSGTVFASVMSACASTLTGATAREQQSMSSNIAKSVITAALLSAYAGHASAGRMHVAFDVVDASTMTNEHFDAILTYASSLTTGNPNTFSGYLVTAINGTQATNPLTLPSIGAT